MRLKYKPASEPLHISVKWLSHGEDGEDDKVEREGRGGHAEQSLHGL